MTVFCQPVFLRKIIQSGKKFHRFFSRVYDKPGKMKAGDGNIHCCVWYSGRDAVHRVAAVIKRWFLLKDKTI